MMLKSLKIDMFSMDVHSGNDYRVAMLSKSYLTITEITTPNADTTILTCLN